MCEDCMNKYNALMRDKPNLLKLLEEHRAEILTLANKLLPIGAEIMNLKVFEQNTNKEVVIDEMKDGQHKNDLIAARLFAGITFITVFAFAERISLDMYASFWQTYTQLIEEGYDLGHAANYYYSQQVKN